MTKLQQFKYYKELYLEDQSDENLVKMMLAAYAIDNYKLIKIPQIEQNQS